MSGFSGFNMGHHVLGSIQAPTAGQTKTPFIIYTYNESVREQRLAQYESDQHQQCCVCCCCCINSASLKLNSQPKDPILLKAINEEIKHAQ